jgi:hypothetical protein
VAAWLGRILAIIVTILGTGAVIWGLAKSSSSVPLTPGEISAPKVDKNSSLKASETLEHGEVDYLNEGSPVTILETPVPMFQTLTYWNGKYFAQLRMQVRETSEPVAPNVRYAGKNTYEERRWNALARAAWFGALLLFDKKPEIQVEFHVERKSPEPEALCALIGATYAALHNRAWPEDHYFAGAIDPTGTILPYPRVRHIARLADIAGAQLVPFINIQRFVSSQPESKQSRIAARPQGESSEISPEKMRQEFSKILGKLMAGNEMGLNLPSKWKSQMQRLEGRFKATELQGMNDWFRLAIVGGKLRAARFLTEFSAARIAPFAARLKRKVGDQALTTAPNEFAWFTKLVRARLQGEADVKYWRRRLPLESTSGRRFRLENPHLPVRVATLRAFAIALNKALRNRVRGQAHPFPYPMGELTTLAWPVDTKPTESLTVDWGMWVNRSAVAWAQYVALMTQRPKQTHSIDVTDSVHGADRGALVTLIQGVRTAGDVILSRGDNALKPLVEELLPIQVIEEQASYVSLLKDLEHAYHRYLLAKEGHRLSEPVF